MDSNCVDCVIKEASRRFFWPTASTTTRT